MFKLFRTLHTLVLITGGLSLVYLVAIARPGTAVKEKLDAEATALILHHLKTKAEFITAEFNTQGVVQVDTTKSLLGFDSQNQLVYQGLGKISAGVDLEQVGSESINVGGNQICIVIPPAEILDVEIEVLRDVVHFQPGLLRADSLEMLEEAQLVFLQQVHQQAQQSGVVDEANQKARSWVEGLIAPLMPSYNLTVTNVLEDCFS